MYLLLKVLLAALIAYGTWLIAKGRLLFPSGKARDALRYRNGKPKFTKRLEEMVLVSFARLIQQFMPMSEFKEKRMAAEFERLERKDTPRQFAARTLARSILFALFGLVLIPFGMPMLTLLILAGAVMAYFKAFQDVRRGVEKVNREIEAELPRLVETLNYSLQDSRDLVSFFEKYRTAASRALGRELDKLVFEMKTGNHTVALRNLDARLQIPQLSSLIAILCGVHQGIDQRTSLMILEQDIRTRQREQMRRLAEKKPGRIKAASLILTVLMILLFMVPLAMLIAGNLKSVF